MTAEYSIVSLCYNLIRPLGWAFELFSGFCHNDAVVNKQVHVLLHTGEEYIPEGETAGSKSHAFVMLSRTMKQSATR